MPHAAESPIASALTLCTSSTIILGCASQICYSNCCFGQHAALVLAVSLAVLPSGPSSAATSRSRHPMASSSYTDSHHWPCWSSVVYDCRVVVAGGGSLGSAVRPPPRPEYLCKRPSVAKFTRYEANKGYRSMYCLYICIYEGCVVNSIMPCQPEQEQEPQSIAQKLPQQSLSSPPQHQQPLPLL